MNSALPSESVVSDATSMSFKIIRMVTPLNLRLSPSFAVILKSAKFVCAVTKPVANKPIHSVKILRIIFFIGRFLYLLSRYTINYNLASLPKKQGFIKFLHPNISCSLRFIFHRLRNRNQKLPSMSYNFSILSNKITEILQ